MKKEKFITSDKLIQKFRGFFFLQRFISFLSRKLKLTSFLDFFNIDQVLFITKGQSTASSPRIKVGGVQIPLRHPT